MKRVLFASTWFQCLWFIAVLGNYDWQIATLLLASVTLVLTPRFTQLPIARISLIVAVGLLVDFINISAGILVFEQSGFPLWLIGLWLAFAWYSNFIYPLVSQYRLILVSIVGGAAGSLSYLAGSTLGAVSLGYDLPLSLTVLLVEWVLLITVIMKVYQHESNRSAIGVISSDK